MSKVERVRRVAEATACTTTQAAEAVDAMLATVTERLQQGEAVIFRRFGALHVRAKRARVGRTPRTGAPAGMTAWRVVRCTPRQMCKRMVDEVTTAVA